MTTRLRIRGARPLALLTAILLTLAVAAPASGRTQIRANSAQSDLQAALQQLVDGGVPGAIAYERINDTSWQAAAGVADLTTGEPITPAHRYRIGSLTKSVTSTLILQLEAEGRLSLNDTVEHWLPGLVPNGADISIRQLLNHTSGIPNYIDLPFLLQVLHDPLRRYTPLELVQYAVANPPLFPPGTGFSYSNTDYILLGMIIAKVDRVPNAPLQSLAPVVEAYARIFAPLGLTHTYWPVWDPSPRGLHTHGYEIDPPEILELPPGATDTTVESPTAAWAAGAVISTVGDVARFHRALFDGQLLPPLQQSELTDWVPAGPGLDYGAGVFKIDTPCGPALGHDGDTPSSFTISLQSLDGSRQFVLAVNQDQLSYTDQNFIDTNNALILGFCGDPAGPAATRTFGHALARMVELEQTG